MRSHHLPWKLALSVAAATALTAAAPAGAKTLPRGVNYGGSNAHDDPIVVLLSKDGKKVVTAGQEFEAKCKSGGYLAQMAKVPWNGAIAADGRFQGTAGTSGQLADGSRTLSVVRLKGKVTGRTMTGTTSVDIQVVDAQGAVTDTCSESSTFKASAKRSAVFAGFTAQGGPAVLELATGNKKIHHLHVGWKTHCVPSGFLQVGDTLMNFPIVHGAFGDSFTTTLGEPGSEQETLNYSVKGRITTSKASGSFRVKVHESDPADGSTADCDTGTVTFKAATG